MATTLKNGLIDCVLVKLDTNRNGMLNVESSKTSMDINVEDNHLIEKSSPENQVQKATKRSEEGNSILIDRKSTSR